MNRFIRSFSVFALIGLAALSFWGATASGAELTFQLVNDTERPLSLKFFSRAESHQEWPSKTKAYTIRPDAAVQQLKLTCEEGEQICWGAWETVQVVANEITGPAGQRATRTHKYSTGAGERGLRTCERCCNICKDGALTPVATLRDPNPDAK